MTAYTRKRRELPDPVRALNLDLLFSSGSMEADTPRRSLWRDLLAFLLAPSPWSDA